MVICYKGMCFFLKMAQEKSDFWKIPHIFKWVQQGQPSRKVWRYDGDDDDDDDATIIIIMMIHLCVHSFAVHHCV